MKSLIEWLQSCLQRYQEAKDLIDEKSRDDPPNVPFRSKYAAREILMTILEETNSKQLIENRRLSPVILIQAVVNYELGLVAVDTEETGLGHKHMKEADRILNESNDIGLTLHKLLILNQLAYLRTSYAEYETALQLLTDAQEYYNLWTERPSGTQLYDLTDAFRLQPEVGAEPETISKIEKAYTLTTYYLAQVYEKLGENDLAAVFCLKTLRRQLDDKDYDPIDWAVNAATLSQYFILKGKLGMGRHLIACSLHTLDDLEARFGLDDNERLAKSQSDVQRIITKFCLFLLEKDGPVESSDFERLLTQDNVLDVEDNMPANHPKSFNEARRIFLEGQKALKKAKKYLTLDEHASNHADCILDESKMYRLLVQFEADTDRKCRMHKRRTDMLENLLGQLNPRYFIAYTRQIMFELGEIYSEMALLKLAQLEDKAPHQLSSAVSKINSLIQKATSQFEHFLKSFNNRQEVATQVQIPEALDDDSVKPFMVAMFSIGRLFTKILTNDRLEMSKNWKKSESLYQMAVDYIERHPEQEAFVSEEFTLIKEMIPMVAEKIKMLINSATLY